MTAWLASGAKTPKLRVYDKYGTPHVRSMGTSDPEEIPEVQAFVKRMRKQKRWDVLNRIIDRRLKAVDAYHLDADGSLNDIIRKLEAEDAAKEALAKVPDLDPLVTEWAEHANAKYVKQVRRLIVEGARFPASDFTKKRISRFLAKLPVDNPTRNRYRVALSQFAKWLVEQEVVETNIVRDVRGYRENDPKDVWYTREESWKLLDTLSGEQRILEVLMYGTGMEWEACKATHARDVNLETREVFAHGGKTRWRNRMVRVTDDKAWEVIKAYVRTLSPGAPLFPELKSDPALDQHQAAVKKLRFRDSTLHDWRHTWAVNWLKEGGSLPIARRQLGHSPRSRMVETVYGVWIVDETDYEAHKQMLATKRATRVKKLLEVGARKNA